MSNLDMLEQVEKARAEKNLAKELKTKGGNFEYEEVEKMAFPQKKWTPFRIIGRPYEIRTAPTDPKFALFCKILKDDKAHFSNIHWKYILKDGEEIVDPDWILGKLYNTVMNKKFVKYTEADVDPSKGILRQADGTIKKDGQKTGTYKFTNSHTEVYRRMSEEGNRTQSTKFPTKVYPKSVLYMNVIDRSDNWCAENNHTKILCKSGNTFTGNDGNLVKYYQDGIPAMLYDQLYSDVFKNRGGWEHIDVAVWKTGKAQPAYYVKDFKSDPSIDDEDVKSKMSDNPLTAEEMAYDKYDLDKLYSVTSYYKLHRDHAELFKLCDRDLGTNYYSELVELAKQETIEKEQLDSVSQETDSSEQHEQPFSENDAVETPEVKVQPVVIPEVAPPVRPVRTPTKGDTVETYFKFWNNLDPEDQKDIKENTKIVNGSYVPNAGVPTQPCDVCGIALPEKVLRCPDCDAQFQILTT